MKHLSLAVLITALCVLLSCSPPPALPPDPNQLNSSTDDSFSGQVNTFASHTQNIVWQSAQELFSEPFTQEFYVMNEDTNWQQLQKHYQTHFDEIDGWVLDTRFNAPKLSIYWVFAFSKGRHFFAVTGLKTHYAENNKMPVSIITNLPKNKNK